MKALSQTWILSTLAVLSLLACGKKSSDGAPAATPPPACTTTTVLPQGQYCSNGQIVQATACGIAIPQGYICMNGYAVPNTVIGASGNLASNVQFQNSYMQGAVNFSGAGSYDFNNPQIIATYSGQVSVVGVVQVLNQSLCGAPVGTYQISGSGYMAMGAISGMILTLSGPAQMQLSVSDAVLENSNTRLGILVSSLIVNGQGCGVITTY